MILRGDCRPGSIVTGLVVVQKVRKLPAVVKITDSLADVVGQCHHTAERCGLKESLFEKTGVIDDSGNAVITNTGQIFPGTGSGL